MKKHFFFISKRKKSKLCNFDFFRKIENVNASLKKNYRINIRSDRSSNSFLNFTIICSLMNNINQCINILKNLHTNETINKMLLTYCIL